MTNLKNLILEHKYEIIVFTLFLLGLFLRLNLNGLPLDHPGNIKAADPFYHVTEVEIIKDTQQWKYNPSYISLNIDKSINQQPPLLYINSAILSIFSSTPSWVTIYFIVSFIAAIRIILLYLISLELTKNKNISLLAAAIYVLPLDVNAWLYEVYIGFWIQVFGLTFLLAFAWLLIKYIKERRIMQINLISLFLVGLSLSHPQDLIFVAIPLVFLLGHILKEKSTSKEKVKKIIPPISIAIIPAITLLPWFLYVWKTQGYKIIFNSTPFDSNYLSGITTPSIRFLPWFELILIAFGIFLVLNNWKNYKPLLLLTGYYSLLVFILPYFLQSPYYLGRTKALIPFIFAPFIAISVYFIITKFISKNSLNNLKSYLVLSLIIIGIAIPSYIELNNNLNSEHIDQAKWNSFLWIQNNVNNNEKIIFLEDCYQSSCILTKEKSKTVQISEFSSKMQEFQSTNSLPLEYSSDWVVDTLWDYPVKEESMFLFVPFDKNELRSLNNKITDFDYVYLRNLNEQFASINSEIVSELQKLDYSIVYNEEGVIILKKNG